MQRSATWPAASILRADALMDGGMLVKSALGMAAVVDTLLPSGSFQITVAGVGPRRPPRDQLLLAVPSGGDRVLPAVFRAVRIFVHTRKHLRLCGGGRKVQALLSDLIKVLLPDKPALAGVVVRDAKR